MVRVAHRKREGVIREDRLDAIRQCAQDVLEKAGGGGTRLLGVNGDHRFPTEVIDGGKFKVIPGVSQGRQVFQVDVQELARSLFFVATGCGSRRPCQTIQTVPKKDALNRAMTEAQLIGDAARAQPPLTQLTNEIGRAHV